MMKQSVDRSPAGTAGVQTATAPDKARAVFNCLSKLVLGRKIYATTNPTLMKFSDDFRAALAAFGVGLAAWMYRLPSRK